MNRLLQLATAILLATTLVPSLSAAPKKEKPAREDVEWIWQYTPAPPDKDGRENALIQDPHFIPFLQQFLTAPQTFWGNPINGRYRSLANTALDHLSVPGKVLADDNRYVSITGCVIHFCPARGLLWIDLNGSHHLVVFAAIDWNKEGHPSTDPEAEYTLWIYSNDPLSTAPHPPAALTKAIARWTSEPIPGRGIVQRITRAVLVDPDGTPHEVPPSALGVASAAPTTSATPATKPGTDNDTAAPALKPRN
jgi:hypothetical protein